MRLRSFTYGGGLLALLLIIAGVTFSVFRVRSTSMSIGVHSYQLQGEEVYASLVLTNTGAVSLAVPLRFGCQVDRASGLTNYLVDTRYTVFLQPMQQVILSNALWRVRLPPDTSAWKVKLRIRQPSPRERLVNAVRHSSILTPRMVSRLAGRPRKEAEYEWHDCGSSWLKVPPHLRKDS